MTPPLVIVTPDPTFNPPLVVERETAVIAPVLIDIPLMVPEVLAAIVPMAVIPPVLVMVRPVDTLSPAELIDIPSVARSDFAITAPPLILTPFKVLAI